MKYTFEEIMSEHEYAQANEMAGYLLHGGLDSEGNYISPRTKKDGMQLMSGLII